MTTTTAQWVMERWTRWQLPVLVLLGLLHRTPVWQVAAGIGPRLVGPTVAVVRSAFTLAAMGTYQTLAGATQLSASPESPYLAKVGEELAAGLAVTGAPASAGSYEVRGTLPPGVTIPGLRGDLVNDFAVSLTGTPTVAGTYELAIRAWQGSNKSGNGGSPTFTYRIVVEAASAPPPPTIQTQPVSATVATGGSVTFNVVATGASGAGGLTYQWRWNGVAIGGATAPTVTLGLLTADANGDYTVAVTDANGTTVSNPATLTVAAPANAPRLFNLSVRAALDANQIVIVGFTMSGGAKSVLLRAAGPTLSLFQVPGVMADPKLDLYSGSSRVSTNDNWGGQTTLSAVFASVGAFPYSSTTSLDAALVASIDGGQTVHVYGPTAGAVLIEAYDAGISDSQRFTNLSARNKVGVGANILIAGFTLEGSGTRNLLIRAVGPKLTDFGVSGVLVDPKLEIYSGTTKLYENDNWSSALSTTFASVGAFALNTGSKDAAITVALPAGGYTVHVSGADGGIGEAIVEIYELP